MFSKMKLVTFFVAVLFPLSTLQMELVSKAVVLFNTGNENNQVRGCVEIQDTSLGYVTITGEITGLQPNTEHGFHVHAFGDIRNGCLSPGGHFNPWNNNHGAPWDYDRHVGDLGNVMSDSNGMVMLNMWDSMVALNGDNSIVGRSFVIHEKRDDLGKGGNAESLKTGNAGARIACGIVGIAAN